MLCVQIVRINQPSPSLRGSGLKSVPPDSRTRPERLPLYEGVD